MKKKAVAVLYSPKNLYDFIRYYVMCGNDYEWTALCGFIEETNQNIIDQCKKLDIFKNIVLIEENYVVMGMKRKMIEFMKMLFAFIIGKQKEQCEKMIERELGNCDYELAVVSSDVGILNGAFIFTGKEKHVVILEDGVSDYARRYDWYKGNINFSNIVGFLLAKMGYANPYKIYKLKSTRYCEKYCCEPERMIYRDYREIKTFANAMQDKNYYELIEAAFGMKKERLKGDIVLFTAAMEDFGLDVSIYVDKIVEYVNRNYSGRTVILKKHPRDEGEYSFSPDVKVMNVDSLIPGEIFINEVQTDRILFVYPSTLVLSVLECRKTFDVLFFKDAGEKNMKGIRGMGYRDAFYGSVDILKIHASQIIEI